MPTSSFHGRHSRELHVANGVADPVLIRLSEGRRRTVLLADDVVYEKPGLMHLHRVRWCRRGGGILLKIREPANVVFAEVRVRDVGGRYLVTVPSEVVSENGGTSLSMLNLTANQYDTLRTATPRRLHLAAENLFGVKKQSRMAGMMKMVRGVRNLVGLKLAGAR